MSDLRSPLLLSIWSKGMPIGDLASEIVLGEGPPFTKAENVVCDNFAHAQSVLQNRFDPKKRFDFLLRVKDRWIIFAEGDEHYTRYQLVPTEPDSSSIKVKTSVFIERMVILEPLLNQP